MAPLTGQEYVQGRGEGGNQCSLFEADELLHKGLQAMLCVGGTFQLLVGQSLVLHKADPRDCQFMIAVLCICRHQMCAWIRALHSSGQSVAC